jgi:ribosome biogenesis GTPase
MTDTLSLADYGWTNHFQAQLDPEEIEALTPARVTAVHRNALEVAAPDLALRIPPMKAQEDEAAAVGDWIVLDLERKKPVRILERKSLFKRRAAGVASKVQLIAANVDTLFIVSSCNQDFNIARLERYLALARDAGALPVVVLTKSDMSDEAEAYAAAARKLMPGLLVETLDGRDPVEASRLAPWCGRGQTVALVGSSGVGKSTLVNTLMGEALQKTKNIREDDAKGRHATTGRSLHRLPAGGWLMDTPGMRELQLTDVADGVHDVFADIAALARACRFSDCGHESEPGCAVRAAIEAGALEEARLKRYRKLMNEEARNSESIAERRARDKSFGKLLKRMNKERRRRGET